MTGFLHWLVHSPWSRAMATYEWLFPIVQSLHFIGFALLIGTIAIVDLRMLGHGMRQEDPAALASDLNRWKWAGLTTILATGFLMFSPSATAYPHNASFRFKMAALAVSLLFHFTLRRRALLNSGRAPTAAAKWTAAASLLLWTAVVAAGRMIAFV